MVACLVAVSGAHAATFGDVAQDATRQVDGKVVVAGYSNPNFSGPAGGPAASTDFTVARYLASGPRDSGFGQRGRVLVDFHGGSDVGRAVALQGNKLIVAGETVGAGSPFRTYAGVTRLTATGSVDSTFGTAGNTEIAPPPAGASSMTHAGALAVYVLPNKSILIGGWCRGCGNGQHNTLMVAKLDSTGRLDTSFATNGFMVLTPNQDYGQAVHALAVDASGGIYAGGGADFSYESTGSVILRLTPTGQLDPNWGTNGVVRATYNPGSGNSFMRSQARALVLRPGGGVYAGDEYEYSACGGGCGGSAAIVSAYDSGGGLVSGFGDAGRAQIGHSDNPSTGMWFLWDLIRTDAGRLMAIGSTWSNSSRYDLAAVQLSPDGHPVAEYGTAGLALLPAPAPGSSSDDIAYSGVTDSDERLYLAGSCSRCGFGSDSFEDFAVGRLTAQGQPDATFCRDTFGGSNGVTLTDFTDLPSVADGCGADPQDPLGNGAGPCTEQTTSGSCPGIRPTRVMSMGDSYTSGEGLLYGHGLEYDCGTALPKASYVKGTTAPASAQLAGGWSMGSYCEIATGSTLAPSDFLTRPRQRYENRCHRHGHAYPNQIRELLGVASGIFLACSAAVTDNIGLVKNPWAQYPDSPANVHGGHPQIEDVRNLLGCGGPIDAVPLDSPCAGALATDLITIGIGGNDAKFKEILMQCLNPLRNCADPDFADTAITVVRQDAYEKILQTFKALRKDFGTATIVAFGYPDVIDPDVVDPALGAPCASLSGVNAEEARWISRDLQPEMNKAIRDAATEAGVAYADIAAATDGHEICTDHPWINGLQTGDHQIAGLIGSESFHPTQTGHDHIAAYFMDHYTDGAGTVLLRNPAPGPADRPAWGEPIDLGTVDAGAVQPCGVDCLQPAACVQSCTVHVTARGFAADTQLNVTLHSDPVNLGTVTTDGSGALSVDIALPTGVPPGLHHLEFQGTSADGTQQLATAQVVIEAPPATVPGNSTGDDSGAGIESPGSGGGAPAGSPSPGGSGNPAGRQPAGGQPAGGPAHNPAKHAAGKRCRVPRLRGKTLARAKVLLRKARCAAGKITKTRARGRKGTVRSTNPRAGKVLPARAKVALAIVR
jgi:uncharacterized delta-60 repeat protein